MLTLEFVCSKNVTRSPAYEAAAQRFVEDNGLTGKLKVESSGVDVEMMNSGKMTLSEMSLYFQMGTTLRDILPKHAYLSGKAEHYLRHGKLDSSKEVMDIAHKIALVVDTFCIQKTSEAILERGLVRTAGQRQTVRQNGNRVVVPVTGKYCQSVANIYGDAPLSMISATEFGKEQSPYGWKLENFLAVVDIAIATTPKIIDHILKEK